MAHEDRSVSAQDSLQKSLLRKEPRQALVKEVVKARRGSDCNAQWTEAARKVAKGESLFLSELAQRGVKARG